MVWGGDQAVTQLTPRAVAPYRLEDARVRLAAAEAQSRDDVQVDEVSAVRHGRGAGEAAPFHQVDHPYVLGQPVAEPGVHLQDVLVRAEGAETEQVVDVL